MKQTYLLDALLPSNPLRSGMKPGDHGLFGRPPGHFRVHVFDCCESSLDKAWELIRENRLDPGDSVLCNTQTRGRGRMGREWVSGSGNIMAAWMIPCPEPGIRDNLLPLILGLTLVRAMLNLGLCLSIKWPNDLIYKDKKVGGILIEEKNHKLVAGIGLNIVFSPEKNMVGESGATEPGNLKDHFSDINPAQLWAKLVYPARIWYEDILCNFSLIDFIREINSNLWLMNEIVTVRSQGKNIEGVLKGIGNEGEILVEHCGGVFRLTSASIIKNVTRC